MAQVSPASVADLVAATQQLVETRGDGERHTVAAGVLTAEGATYLGLNLFHFTGGPCAEVVALARMVSEGGRDPVAVVAVGDRGRSVVAPCGRCRQVMADYAPGIDVIVDVDGAHQVKPLLELLPHAYLVSDQS